MQTLTKKTDQNIYFSDFSYDFTPHPKTGDITILKNEDAVKASVKNLLQTKTGEILFDSMIGSGLYYKLFEPMDIITLRTMQREIVNTLQNYEPRVSVIDVRFEIVGDHGLNISLFYNIINKIETQKVDVFLEKIR
jgi:phage baseplate assembly protein W